MTLFRPRVRSLSPLLLGCVVCFSPWARAVGGQDATVGEPTIIHFHGVVLDGVTGKPLTRVLVSSLDRRMATMTNNDGAFTLDVPVLADLQTMLQMAAQGGNPAFRLALDLRKPGYLEPSARPWLSLEQSAATATFRLMPSGTVEGNVTAASPEPPGRVPISLLMHTAVNGDWVWNIVGGEQTDREGKFRFTNLRPGEYAVMSSEWRGDQPLPPSPKAVTEQYPPAYFGDASTLAGASHIRLHFGEVVHADLHLRPAPYYPVTVPVGGAVEGVNVRVLTGQGPSGYQLGYNQATHAVEGSLPSGTYTLLINSYHPQQAYASVSLHVGEAPVRSAEVVPVPGAPIVVRVHRDFTGKGNPPDRLNPRVYLLPQEQGLAFPSAVEQPGQGDTLLLSDVEPGLYRVRAEAGYGYAAEIRSGGEDLRTQLLHVGDGGASAPIDVTFRDDTGSVSGNVTAASGNLPNQTYLCLVPLDSGAHPVMATASADGKFSMPTVIPGNYRLLASTRPFWGVAWQDPEVLRVLDAHGTAVTVTPNGSQSAETQLLDDQTLELP